MPNFINKQIKKKLNENQAHWKRLNIKFSVFEFHATIILPLCFHKTNSGVENKWIGDSIHGCLCQVNPHAAHPKMSAKIIHGFGLVAEWMKKKIIDVFTSVALLFVCEFKGQKQNITLWCILNVLLRY